MKQQSVLTLPLTPEQCLDGLTRVIASGQTSVGRELSEYFERRDEETDARQQAKEVIKEKMEVCRTRDGVFTAALMMGYPISTEQAIEQQLYSEKYPGVDFEFLTAIRTFSFECWEFDEVMAIFNAAKQIGVCMTLTNMCFQNIDIYKPSAFGKYAVEIVTTSRMSMICRAMREAKTNACETLRECPLIEYKLYANETREEEIEALEELEIERRIACGQQL